MKKEKYIAYNLNYNNKNYPNFYLFIPTYFNILESNFVFHYFILCTYKITVLLMKECYMAELSDIIYRYLVLLEISSPILCIVIWVSWMFFLYIHNQVKTKVLCGLGSHFLLLYICICIHIYEHRTYICIHIYVYT